MPSLVVSTETQTGRVSRDGVDWPITVRVDGVADEAAAWLYAMDHCPQFFGGAALDSLDVKETVVEGFSYKLVAKYSLRRRTPLNAETVDGQPTPEALEIEYDLRGETRHVQEALSTVRYPDTAPDNGKLIGVSADGVAGADLETNVETFSIVKQIPLADITDELRDTWRSVRGKTNNATWRTFPTGEVRLDSVSFRISGADTRLVPVRFGFTVRPNQSNVQIDEGGPFSVPEIPEVGGWQIVDIVYKPIVDGTNNRTIQRAWAVYLHTVLHSADFGLLELE